MIYKSFIKTITIIRQHGMSISVREEINWYEVSRSSHIIIKKEFGTGASFSPDAYTLLYKGTANHLQRRQLKNKKMGKEKLKLSDTTMDVVVKMSEGNPGAATVIMKILTSNNIDPDNAMGGLGAIFMLDTYGIYGTGIHILHKHICDGDLPKTLAVLRATQMGIFDSSILKDACYRQDGSGKLLVPVEDIYIKVKERLPNFDTEVTS